MSYRIKQKESIEESVQRIAREQTNKAIAELDDSNLDAHAAVHQARKRCKKIRGLIRLVRPEFKVYSLENAWYRDSARPLSYVRDAQSIIDTLDKLLDHFTDEMDRPAFSPVRRRLTERRKEIMQDEVALHERLAEFSDRMREGRERVAAWRLQEDGFEAVEEGIAKTYRRGRDAMQTAFQKPRSARFHEWRKRAKYHWYHMRVLRPIWPEPIKARRDEVDRLASLLGDDHDLSVLRATLLESVSEFGDERVQMLLGLISQRQVELRTKCSTLGARVFAEKPARLAKRLHRYWQAWKTESVSADQATHRPDLVTV